MAPSRGHAMTALLAIDLGLRCGFAVYDDGGRLLSFRSTHFGSRTTLKAAIPSILASVDGLACVYAEGDANLARLWERETTRRGARFVLVPAETWRASLLLERERRSGSVAKESADTLARKVIERVGVSRPTSLRHDAAEAILIGLYGATAEGWTTLRP